MRLKFIKDEDFVNYKKAAMFLGTVSCSFKCCTEQGLPISICQNEPWCSQPVQIIENNVVINRYFENPLTSAIVLGGLEPFEQFDEILHFVSDFRKRANDDIVVYSGFYPEEISSQIEQLKQFPNIIIKFGRYIPNRPSRYDEVLGVTLVSDNQFAKKIS